MAVADFFLGQLVRQLKFPPTECQERLFETLTDFITSPSVDVPDLMIVSGYAGTGKTSAIAAFVQVLRFFKHNYILLAPTGRSAKVLSNFTEDKAFTIHKHIYRQKSMTDGVGLFQLDVNKSNDTCFIVDEASLISVELSSEGSVFGSGDLLDDLIQYVRQGSNNKLIIIGDKGQLPPIGMLQSPALDSAYMRKYGDALHCELTTVVRQAQQSGILTNATILRRMIESSLITTPQLDVSQFVDVERITGGELIEKISDEMSRVGLDNLVVLCRSNKRANRYNSGIRSTILFCEEKLTKGDKLMVVKNCYQFLENIPELEFIANGDVAELMKISKYEQRYGLNFAEAVLSFPDYKDVEITAKVILDTLDSESAALTKEQQYALFQGVYADYDNIKTKRKRYSAVREDKYFNALQIKYATAITCHKSQGGQWKSVFIDNPFWKDITLDDLKWLYTAVTRGVEKVFFVNFKDDFFKK